MPKTSSTTGKAFAGFGELLRKLRIRVGQTQAELAEASGVNHSYLSRLESGERQPSPKMLRRLAPVLNYPYDELAIAAGILDREFHEQQRAHEPERAATTELLRQMMAQIQSGGGSATASTTVQRRGIPVYDTVPAGLFKDANVVESCEDVPYLVLSDEELGYDPRAFALIVSGDSMVEAAILDGDVLVVSPNTRVKNGDIAVVSVDKTATTVKKIYFEAEQVILQPCNSQFRPQVLNASQIEVLGKVILVRRKLH